MNKFLKPTDADNEMITCLNDEMNFSMIAGAGSGKTTSLVNALSYLQEQKGAKLLQNGQRIVCITFTKRAVAVISEKIQFDDLFLVSTLHKFLWEVIKRFNADIRDTIIKYVLPSHIKKASEKDNGGSSKAAIKAREKTEKLKKQLAAMPNVSKFHYEDTEFSDYINGILSHTDVIDIAAYMLLNKPLLRKVIGFKFPYIFVDEAQDTFENVVDALNAICEKKGSPSIGYFGDPMQQIYDKRAGDFEGPEGSKTITKNENFRCSISVINLLNAIRVDIEQFPAGENRNTEGSVEIILAQAEAPELGKKYSDKQLENAIKKFNSAIESWGWTEVEDAKHLYLVRQMIARRLNFSNLQNLYTGTFASSKAQNEYNDGGHYLLKPFLTTICPLIKCIDVDDWRQAIGILRKYSPSFDSDGKNQDRTLNEMIKETKRVLAELNDIWKSKNIREVLNYSKQNNLFEFSERLSESLKREKRVEEYDNDNEEHVKEKGEWLCDNFFEMKTTELLNYFDFINENTPLSTQHGVKGEEYKNVLVVFDDVEASWNQYNFSKTLSPMSSGEAKETIVERTRKLIYVCFSRAEENLRVLLFTSNPHSTKEELMSAGLFTEEQIKIQ